MSWIRHILARLAQLVTFGKLQDTTAKAGTRAKVRARVLGEDEEVPWLQPAGLQSRPYEGEALVLAPGGSSDAAVAAVVAEPGWNIALGYGETALVTRPGSNGAAYIKLEEGVVSIVVPAGTAGLSWRRILLGSNAHPNGVARLADTVDANASMQAWMAAVNAAFTTINGIHASVVVPPAPPTTTGAISSASLTVFAED